MITRAEESRGVASDLAIHDAAAHARVLSQQLHMAIAEIRDRYPNNSLGGLVDRVSQLSVFANVHADALSHAADTQLLERGELVPPEAGAELQAPASVLTVFERAELLEPELSVPEAAQLAAQGKLVILRDKRVQERHLKPHGAAIFGPGIDWTVVRLWWPRIFSRELAVALMSTDFDGVWIETTMGEEDLPE
ncbi:MAG: hypothetical protein HYX47_12725 [Burkholderiales bacterium]|nr:hypothetical protein [Burkholderiales bacterium]